MKFIHSFFISIVIISGCSPIKTSAKNEQHQMELTLHDTKTNLDHLKHDINCLQAEMQILDSKIHNQENTQNSFHDDKLPSVQNKLVIFENRISTLEAQLQNYNSSHQNISKNLLEISVQSEDTGKLLLQYKNRITELENSLAMQTKKLDEISKIKSTLDTVIVSLKEMNSSPHITYKVKQGDSLEKIAKTHHISVEVIKKYNNLDHDLIIIGQDLKIPKQ